MPCGFWEIQFFSYLGTCCNVHFLLKDSPFLYFLKFFSAAPSHRLCITHGCIYSRDAADKLALCYRALKSWHAVYTHGGVGGEGGGASEIVCAFFFFFSDGRLSLKLKQGGAHPPSQLYLFMPSSPQRPRACKHSNPPASRHTLVRVSEKKKKKKNMKEEGGE